MVSSQNEPSIIIRDLLENNWNSSNTNNITPDFLAGWWDETRTDNMITLTGGAENPVDGGQTGFFAVQSGKGPAKLMIGTLQADCWSAGDQFDTSNTNAKDVVYNFSEEVKRITTNEAISVSGLRFISWIGRTEVPALDESPVLERQSCNIRFGYYIFP